LALRALKVILDHQPQIKVAVVEELGEQPAWVVRRQLAQELVALDIPGHLPEQLMLGEEVYSVRHQVLLVARYFLRLVQATAAIQALTHQVKQNQVVLDHQAQ
jgi:hypothetical protein